MKKTTKLAGVVAGLLVLAGTTFTSCDPDFAASIGKDDFVGTWETYDITGGSVARSYKSTESGNNNYYRVIWNFNGKSENITNDGVFTQRIINYGTTAPTDVTTGNIATNDNFWLGTYDIKGNSSYNKGKYLMNYQIGMNIQKAVTTGYTVVESAGKKSLNKGSSSLYSQETADKIYDLIKDWKIEDFLNFAYGNTDGLTNLKNDATLKSYDYSNTSGTNGKITTGTDYKKNDDIIPICIRYSGDGKKLLCNTRDYYRFQLADSSGSGYTRMMVTSYGKNGSDIIGSITNEWKESDGKYQKIQGSSWSGGFTRYMARVSKKDGNFLTNSGKSNQQTFKLADAEDNIDYAGGWENDDGIEK